MLAKRAERIDRKLKETPRGVFPIMEIFQVIMGIIGMCPKPVVPAPVNPTPSPSPVQAAAWDDAWKLKSTAEGALQDDGSYSGKGFQKTVAETRKKSRRDGQKMKKSEAIEAVSAMFDDARSSTMPDLFSDVLEARHAT